MLNFIKIIIKSHSFIYKFILLTYLLININLFFYLHIHIVINIYILNYIKYLKNHSYFLLMTSEILSAIIIVGALVFPLTI